MEICQFCNKEFSGKPTLIKHQRSVKSCLKLQENAGHFTKKLSYKCSFCDKELSSNHGYSYHIKICSIKKEKDTKAKEEEEVKIKEETKLRERIKELEDKLSKHEIEPKNIHSTTNIITNMSNSNNTNNTNISIINYMTEERVLQIFKDHFQLKDLEQSRLGMFTVKHMLTGEDKPVYKCTDLSRKRCVYIDTSGNETVDKNMKTLINLLHQANPYVKELIQDDIIDQEENVITTLRSDYKDYINLETDGSEFKTVVSKCASDVPTPSKLLIDDIDWDINIKRAKLKEPKEQTIKPILASDEDEFGFFS